MNYEALAEFVASNSEDCIQFGFSDTDEAIVEFFDGRETAEIACKVIV